jgi:hypothetical protein
LTTKPTWLTAVTWNGSLAVMRYTLPDCWLISRGRPIDRAVLAYRVTQLKMTNVATSPMTMTFPGDRAPARTSGESFTISTTLRPVRRGVNYVYRWQATAWPIRCSTKLGSSLSQRSIL